MAPQPASTNGSCGWMMGQRQYAGLAYGKWRDVVCIVNPGQCNIGATTYPCPGIYIWKAQKGATSTTYGRDTARVMLPSEMHTYRLNVNGTILQKKMVLMK